MIHRREFLAGIAAMMAVPHSLDAQQAGKMYRIGVLSLYDPSTFPQLMQAFREGMREAGYLEGRHYALEMRNAAGKPAELGAVARTLVAQSHRTRAVFDRYNIVDERDLRDGW